MSFIRVILFLSFLLITSLANSEIYSWVDENGRKHFGNEIPQEYLPQVELVDVDYEEGREEDVVSSEERAKKAYKAARELKKSNWEHRNSLNAQKKASKNTQTTSKKSNSRDSCEERKVQYRKSQSCFAGCQKRNHHVHSTYSQQTGFSDSVGTEMDLSECGHCTSMEEPIC